MNHRNLLQRLWPLALTAVLGTGGCLPVDRWEMFRQEPEPLPYAAEPVARVEPVPFEFHDLQPLPTDLRPEDGPLALSTEQAIVLALGNNRDLAVRRLAPVIEGAGEEAERGRFDPELFAEVNADRERSQESSRSSGEQFDVSARDADGVIGLRQLLPTGTTFEATIAQERSISNRSPEQQVARAGLSVTQSLLRGFGPDANLASVRQAELGMLASLYELRGYTEALLSDTEIAYWEYVLAREEIAILEKSLAVAKTQREEIELRIEVGVLPEIEVAAARAEEALRVQALIDGRSQLEDRRLRLLRLTGLASSPGRFDQQLSAVSDPRLQPVPLDNLVERLELGEQSRADLNEARLRLQQARLETVRTRNGLLPRLDLFISLGKTGYADTFSDSFREMDGKTYDLTAGIRLESFIGNRDARGAHLAAEASARQGVEAVANLRQLVELDVLLAANQVRRAEQQIDATRVTRLHQEQTLRAEKERFDVGASTALQVAQAQRDLLGIEIQEVEAVVNYRIALVQLYLAEGSLLERRGITIAGEGGLRRGGSAFRQ